MLSGFDNWKDIFDVVVIPVTVAVLAILFPAIQSRYIRRQFKKLILRELQEINPKDIKKINESGKWFFHLQKRCIHKELFDKPSENRAFILSLPPELVYYLTNFWNPENSNDPISGLF